MWQRLGHCAQGHLQCVLQQRRQVQGHWGVRQLQDGEWGYPKNRRPRKGEGLYGWWGLLGVGLLGAIVPVCDRIPQEGERRTLVRPMLQDLREPPSVCTWTMFAIKMQQAQQMSVAAINPCACCIVCHHTQYGLPGRLSMFANRSQCRLQSQAHFALLLVHTLADACVIWYAPLG